MSINDQNDLILLCENQFWLQSRVIVDTELIRSLFILKENNWWPIPPESLNMF